MKQDQNTVERNFLRGWKLRIALLAAIVSPAITATGAYYNMKADLKAEIVDAKDQIDAKYVRKESLDDLKEDVHDVKQDVKDIKNLLIRRSR